MSAELEKIFSPEMLAAFDERMRKIVEEARGAGEAEWLDVPGAMAYISAKENAVREIIARLKATFPEDVFQPNGPGTKPLLVRRSALRDLGRARR
jgi:hypothetical protein